MLWPTHTQLLHSQAFSSAESPVHLLENQVIKAYFLQSC